MTTNIGRRNRDGCCNCHFTVPHAGVPGGDIQDGYPETEESEGEKKEALVMAEYIEREALLKIAKKQFGAVLTSDILEQTAADVAPVVHGKWMLFREGKDCGHYRCSECGRYVGITGPGVVGDLDYRKLRLDRDYPYCHCGAKMDLN